eukprot:395049-Rhodomonas_salina.1
MLTKDLVLPEVSEYGCNSNTQDRVQRGCAGSDSLLDAIDSLPSSQPCPDPFTKEWDAVMVGVDVDTMVSPGSVPAVFPRARPACSSTDLVSCAARPVMCDMTPVQNSGCEWK